MPNAIGKGREPLNAFKLPKCGCGCGYACSYHLTTQCGWVTCVSHQCTLLILVVLRSCPHHRDQLILIAPLCAQ